MPARGSKPEAPAVSVVMATYNGSAFIEATIRSLQQQSFSDFELIAVDDCSTDRTVAVLQSFADSRIGVLSTACNAGPVAARNQAVAAARGRYIAALDQDDLCHPDRLRLQVAYLEDHPRVAILGTASRRLIGERIAADTSPARTSPGLLRWLLHVANPLVWSSVMIRTDAARALNPFSRPERQFAEDFDLYHRLAGHGEIARLDSVQLTYRCHPDGASRTRQSQMIASAVSVLADAYRGLGLHQPDRMAELMTRHIATREPVPDRATMQELNTHLAAMTDAVTSRYALDAPSQRMIAAEMVRLRRLLNMRWLESTLRKRQKAKAFVPGLNHATVGAQPLQLPRPG